MKMIEKLLGLAFFLLCAWLFLDAGGLNGEITIYEDVCFSGGDIKNCPKDNRSLTRMTYKAILETQTIVYWNSFSDDNFPMKMSDCAIRNEKNWACNSGETFIYMINGQYAEMNQTTYTKSIYINQLPKWRWWFNHLNEMANKL